MYIVCVRTKEGTLLRECVCETLKEACNLSQKYAEQRSTDPRSAHESALDMGYQISVKFQ